MKKTKHLALRATTIAVLTSHHLRAVAGARWNDPGPSDDGTCTTTTEDSADTNCDTYNAGGGTQKSCPYFC